MSKGQSSENGFTLLEVIIVITITGLILGVAISFLEQGLSTWERVGRTNEWEQHHRMLERTLEQDLHNLFFAELYREYQFKGDYQGFQLIVGEEDRLYRVDYSIDYYNNQLVRRTVPLKTEATKEERQADGKELRFFNDLRLERVEFLFYDPVKKYWVPSWSYQETAQLPRVVRLKIRTAEFSMPLISAEIYIGQTY